MNIRSLIASFPGNILKHFHHNGGPADLFSKQAKQLHKKSISAKTKIGYLGLFPGNPESS